MTYYLMWLVDKCIRLAVARNTKEKLKQQRQSL